MTLKPAYGGGVIDNFSTSEVATNRRWIDGKIIYRKIINFGSLPNLATKDVAHGITGIDNFISITGIVDAGTYQYNLPEAHPSDANNKYLFADADDVSVQTGGDATAHTAFIVLEYTKT